MKKFDDWAVGGSTLAHVLNGQVSPRRTGIQISNKISVPKLTREELLSLQSKAIPKVITRHLDPKYLPSAIGGYFRFGTTGGYRAQENLQEGRFSDVSEGRLRQSFRRQDGHFADVQIGKIIIRDSFFDPSMDQVVYDETFNDFCNCSSVGEFDEGRAEVIRSKGNEDLGAFVSYDLQKLIFALAVALHANQDAMESGLLVRPIKYGQKDSEWEIPRRFRAKASAAEIDRWLSASFVKPDLFDHEAELRILLIDPSKPGGLADTARPLEVMHSMIAKAIVRHGHF